MIREERAMQMKYIAFAAGIAGADMAVKKRMEEALSFHETRPLAGGKLALKKYHNKGAAGNLLERRPRALKGIQASLLSYAVIRLLLLKKDSPALAKVGLACVVGGGCSNFCDRLLHGYVTDYFSFRFGPERFQNIVFNLSDFFVFVGAALLLRQAAER